MIRDSTPKDAETLAGLHLDVATYYTSLDANHFRVPDAASTVDFFRALLARGQRDDAVWWVATDGDDVIGTVHASVREPIVDADIQLERDLGERIVYVHSLAVAAEHRRRGVGRTLMRRVETWARNAGATRVLLDTYAHSALSIDFYEAGLGYDRRAIVFEKRL